MVPKTPLQADSESQSTEADASVDLKAHSSLESPPTQGTPSARCWKQKHGAGCLCQGTLVADMIPQLVGITPVPEKVLQADSGPESQSEAEDEAFFALSGVEVCRHQVRINNSENPTCSNHLLTFFSLFFRNVSPLMSTWASDRNRIIRRCAAARGESPLPLSKASRPTLGETAWWRLNNLESLLESAPNTPWEIVEPDTDNCVC